MPSVNEKYFKLANPHWVVGYIAWAHAAGTGTLCQFGLASSVFMVQA